MIQRVSAAVFWILAGAAFILALAHAQTVPYYADLFGDPRMSLRYSRFMKTADRFDRQLAGCAPQGTDACNPNLGVFNAALWKQLCDEAPTVFRKQ
jgi:hypothetical protein